MALRNLFLVILFVSALTVFLLDTLDELIAFSPLLLMTTEYAPHNEEGTPEIKSIWLQCIKSRADQIASVLSLTRNDKHEVSISTSPEFEAARLNL